MPEVTDGAAPGGAAPDEKHGLPPGDSSKPGDPGATADSPPGDDKRDSSTRAADKRPATSFDAVMQLMQERKPAEGADAGEDKPGGESPTPEGKDAAAAGDEPDPKAEKQPEEKPESYEPIKKPRSEAERRLNTLLGERKEFLPKAQTFDQLQEWTKGHGLTPEQFMRGMEVMALTRTDPAKALEALEPIITALRAEVGIVDKLPEDLQAQVDSGAMNEAGAKEIAALRLKNASTERRLTETREQNARGIEQERVGTVRQAFSEFEQQQAKSDPDWNEKRSDVQDKLKAIWLDEGLPATPKAAREQASKAVAAVNERWKKLRPAKEAISPKLNGGSNPRNVAARPKTSMDALNAALAGQPIQY